MYILNASVLPYVQHLWWMRIEEAAEWVDVARETWGLAFTRRTDGTLAAELVGPAYGHNRLGSGTGDEYWGVDFYAHITMRGVDKPALTGKFVSLPVRDGYFFIDNDSYKIPAFADLEPFLVELERQGIISNAARALHLLTTESLRSNQRRYRQTVGLSRRQAEQIRRAEQAAAMLESGASPAEVAAETGYADQAHMTRVLKNLLGKTPAQLRPPK